MGWRFIVCLSALCLPMSLPLAGDAAENPGADTSFYATDEVVISATRTPVVGRSASAVTVLTQEEIQRSPYPGAIGSARRCDWAPRSIKPFVCRP